MTQLITCLSPIIKDKDSTLGRETAPKLPVKPTPHLTTYYYRHTISPTQAQKFQTSDQPIPPSPHIPHTLNCPDQQ